MDFTFKIRHFELFPTVFYFVFANDGRVEVSNPREPYSILKYQLFKLGLGK